MTSRVHSVTRALLLFCLATITAPLVVGEERWVEGQHYQILNPPVAVGRGDDVVVTEFFWYGCGRTRTKKTLSQRRRHHDLRQREDSRSGSADLPPNAPHPPRAVQ